MVWVLVWQASSGSGLQVYGLGLRVEDLPAAARCPGSGREQLQLCLHFRFCFFADFALSTAASAAAWTRFRRASGAASRTK